MKQINNKSSIDVPNNYVGFMTLLQAMGLLAVLGIAIAWIGSFFGL